VSACAKDPQRPTRREGKNESAGSFLQNLKRANSAREEKTSKEKESKEKGVTRNMRKEGSVGHKVNSNSAKF